MSGVQHVTVASEEGEIRLDRWFQRRFPEVSHVRLQKLLRTGQVRIDGKRAKAGDRLAPGQAIRVPPLGQAEPPRSVEREMSDVDAEFVRDMVIHRDPQVIALNKPPGLATQGGTGQKKHLDGLLDALRFGGERPRLVHRLDRDTSGVLLLARTVGAATKLGDAFRGRDARKVYWALTVGVPRPSQGTIDLPLAKLTGRDVERMGPDPEGGKPAVTDYRVLETASHRLAWVALWPRTGRTHQLRAHMVAIGRPILGDGKYGGERAFLSGIEVPPMLHLHARSISLPHPSGRGTLHVSAPLPDHIRRTFALFNFDPNRDDDPFAGRG